MEEKCFETINLRVAKKKMRKKNILKIFKICRLEFLKLNFIYK